MRGQPNFAHSGDVKTRAKTQKTCQKGVLKPLSGVIRADRVIDDEVSVAQEVMRPPSRGSRTELPSAETDAWFLQGKGIFTGASPVLFPTASRARGNQITGLVRCLREG